MCCYRGATSLDAELPGTGGACPGPRLAVGRGRWPGFRWRRALLETARLSASGTGGGGDPEQIYVRTGDQRGLLPHGSTKTRGTSCAYRFGP
ncbi:hypothetical protein UG55_10881 [Frankia sp. EI5c]|nr:hypothetical protein UG55_10881 [Frankia sp. EI5c]